jgi:geranyl-CoA carboxylase beta subunit
VSRLSSRLNPRSAAFAANAAAMQARLDEVLALQARVVAESDSKRDKFAQRGQLLPRERVARLIDRGSDFLELSPLAGLGLHDDDGKKAVLGGGSVIGIGWVAGKRVLVSASDSAIKGGTVAPLGLKKALRAQQIAAENRLPLIYLVESGGANLMYQSEMFVEGGRSFANQARLSAQGVPQIAVVHGSSTAGGAYLPGLSDYVLLVRDRSSIFLAGPPLVKAAIGEDASDEELGGAELHARVTGLGEYLCEDDAHALATVRELLALLPWPQAPVRAAVEAPQHPAEELLGVVPADERRTLRRARGDRAPGRRLGLPRVQGRLRPRDRVRPCRAWTATPSA